MFKFFILLLLIKFRFISIYRLYVLCDEFFFGMIRIGNLCSSYLFVRYKFYEMMVEVVFVFFIVKNVLKCFVYNNSKICLRIKWNDLRGIYINEC